MGHVQRKPAWLKATIPGGQGYSTVAQILRDERLPTVCREARCPNIGECYNSGTATFLLLGDTCTRNCRYCAINNGKPTPADPDEPQRVARAVVRLQLQYAVLTSVTRDDLADGGASHFAATVTEIMFRSPETRVEVLIPDFAPRSIENLQILMERTPFVINHNIETAASLFPSLRPAGSYSTSLTILAEVSSKGMRAKSGLMIGLGEDMEDIHRTIDDLANAGVSILTVGQYLQSSKTNVPVARYYHPDEFVAIADHAREAGIPTVFSAPNVRSSYHAADAAGMDTNE